MHSLLLALCLAIPAADRPNIILFMADDMGYEGVSAYGSPDYATPRLDRLAAEGVRFTHCYSTPICTTSRVQIMTGRYNHENYLQFGLLDPREPTFGNLLRDAGYATGIVGKWQLGGDAETVRRFGFDDHLLWHLDGRGSRFWEPRLSRNGKLMENVADSYGPDLLADFACDFLERNREKPFFLYYPMVLVHWPFVPTPDSPEGGSRERSGKYDGQAGGVEYFDDMVAYMDKIVGRVVDKVDQLGLGENTLILFTADNGSATNIVSRMGDTTIQGGKASLPDAGTRVALVARCTGKIKPGQVSDALVDFTDFLPTFAEAAGVSTGAPAERPLPGHSLWGHLTRGEPGPRPWVFCHYTRDGHPAEPRNAQQRERLLAQIRQQREAKKLGRFARDSRYKLYDDGRFYDIEADVLEQRAIAPGAGTAAAEEARRALQNVHDQMPPWSDFRKRGN